MKSPSSARLIAAVLSLTVLAARTSSGQTITTQPQNVTVTNGGVALFDVVLSGTGPFTYQWQFDTVDLTQNPIRTVAGNGTAAYAGDNGPSLSASLHSPSAVAVDAHGNVFIADTYNQRIREAGTNGVITTVAGTGTSGYSGDNLTATNANLSYPAGIAVDSSGDLFIADTGNGRIRRVGTNGVITTVAGNGTNGFFGDGGMATNASLFSPVAVAVDGEGNLFIADSDNERIRKVSAGGVITTIAGDGDYGFSGDNGLAINAELWLPAGVAVDSSGNVFIADEGNQRVRKVGTGGIITTVAGNGLEAFAGDNGPATGASLYFPDGVAVDSFGDIFISDSFTNRIRRVTPNGAITTLAGTGPAGEAGDGGAATNGTLNAPAGLATDSAGDLFISDYGGDKVREVLLAGTLTLSNVTVYNSGSYRVIVTGPALSLTSSVATLNVLAAPEITSQPDSQDILVGGNVTFSVTAIGSLPLSYAWSINGAPVSGQTNSTYSLNALPLGDSGGLYACIVGNTYGSVTSAVATLTVGTAPVISAPPTNQGGLLGGSVTLSAGISGTGPFAYQWLQNGTNPVNIIMTVAGNGTTSYTGDNNPATNAGLYYPTGVAADAFSNVFIVDQDHEVIRKVAPDGIITTYAGKGSAGYAGDNGPATNASLYNPLGVAVDIHGNVFIADYYNFRIRMVNTNGIITTVAGNGTYGFGGDGGQATNANLYYPDAVAADTAGNLFIADTSNYRVRKVNPNGIITTVAGDGSYGYSGDGGAATAAELTSISGVACDASGNLFLADRSNYRVRKVSATGIISTVAGNGGYGYSGDYGPATSATLESPYGVAVDGSGNLFISDASSERIRKVSAKGIITTLAGTGSNAFFGDGGLAINGSLYSPTGVAVDPFNDVFVADEYNFRIREISSPLMLTLTNLIGSNGGSYQLVVSSPFGSVTSSVATLTILYAPSIAGQPADQFSLANGSATFTVTATGTPTLAYAWYRNGAAIAGATTSTYTTNNVKAGDSGSPFYCVITNNYGVVTSSVATLTIGTVPGISAQPTNQSVLQGGDVKFGLTLTGTGPFSYQWLFDGTNVPFNTIETIAGDGIYGFGGDGGPGTNANLENPVALAVDSRDDVFVDDYYTERIREVGSNGIINTVAGNGDEGFAGDGGSAIVDAKLGAPLGVAVDAYGNFYIADSSNYRVRRVGTNGVITTVAGGGSYGFYGDGGPASNAYFEYPNAVAVDAAGDLYVSDEYTYRVRKITNGIIMTVAGNGTSTFSGDGGPATNAGFYPAAIAVDQLGNLFIADSSNERVRKVGTNGIITTIAGNGAYGYTGDNGSATNAKLYQPSSVAVDALENVFIADKYNDVIRMVNANGIITTFAGSGRYGFTGDGGDATNATFREPSAVAVDSFGNVFIADQASYVVREVAPFGSAGQLSLSGLAATNGGTYQVIVTSPYGSITSSIATLTVLIPAEIVTEPTGAFVPVGGNAVFGVTAAGTAPLAYSWRNNGAPILGATSSNYTATDVTLAESGTAFTCVVSNTYGIATSLVASLTVGIPPSVAPEPTNQTILVGGDASFGVGVAGTGPFTYAWQHDGTNVPGGLIYTVAGDGSRGSVSNNVPANEATFDYPHSVALDSFGNLFIADTFSSYVRKLGTNGYVTIVAGNGVGGFSGDGGSATNASFDEPEGVAVDAFGNLFIADTYDSRIRKVGTNGIVTTIAGIGSYGFAGDGAGATNATLGDPFGVAVGADGTVYIADTYNNRVRSVAPNGIITTVAGNGNIGDAGDGGLAVHAELYHPEALALDNQGNLYIADSDNSLIRKVDAAGIISTVAGGGVLGDGGPATKAFLDLPQGVAVDGQGNIFIADSDSERIRKVNTDGIISTVAGNGAEGFYGDGGSATSAWLEVPTDVAVNSSGDLFISDSYNQRIREVIPFGSAPTLVLTNLNAGDAGGYDVIVTTPFGAVTSTVAQLVVLTPPSIVIEPASLDVPVGANAAFDVTADGTQPLHYTWYLNGSAIAGATGSTYTNSDVQLANSGGQFTCLVSNAYGKVLTESAGLTVGTAPGILMEPSNEVAGASNNFSVTASGTGPFSYQWLFNGTNLPFGLIYTMAGNGTNGFLGDGGPAVDAEFDYPADVAVDDAGNVFVSDLDNYRIRKIAPNGVITTFAGDGIDGSKGDGGPATNAELAPRGICADAVGNLYICDAYSSRVRKVDTNGIITTFAGNGTNGYSGDGGPAAAASLDNPRDIAFDATGNLYIADSGNWVIRRVNTNGIISTYAGNGTEGYSGDGGPATNSELDGFETIAVDAPGNLFIVDSANEFVRKVDVHGFISTVAGNGYFGFSGDGGPATNASFTFPFGVAVDTLGDLFLSDGDTYRVRMVNRAGMITTVAGSGLYGYLGDGGPSTSAGLRFPAGIRVDASGNLLIADEDSHVIRKVIPFGTASTLSLTDGSKGQYQVIVTSPFGSVASTIVTLSGQSTPPPPQTPVITSAVRSGNGSVTLNLQTAPNTASVIYATLSLAPPIQWQPIFTNSNAGATGIWQFIDTSVDNYKTRFFLVLTP